MDATPRALPSLDDILAARETLRGIAHMTPILMCETLSKKASCPLYLKCEQFQRGGSFKLRGAYVKMASCLDDARAHGVVAYSSGNHAQGVALAARMLGVTATIFMPEDAPGIKVDAVRTYGADIQFVGTTSDEREAAARAHAEMTGALVIPPFDDPHIIAGQGTVGIEILEQCPSVERVVVPVGGGGLISGVSIAVKASAPSVEVVGVEPEQANAMSASLQANAVTDVRPGPTIADGLKPTRPGELTFQAARAHVDRMVTVSEQQIREATRDVLQRAKLVVEPSGAAAVAACQADVLEDGRTTVAVLSGGNIDFHSFFCTP
ncbi:pyridoxal-phosphate dependent enzyme [archaeon]|nr:MAG: pyridoxal-phosphate dependent enzyme [archaeon]